MSSTTTPILKNARTSNQITSEDECFDFITTWKRICQDGLYFFAKKYQLSVEALELLNLQIRTQEELLVAQLRVLNPADYDAYVQATHFFTRQMLETNAFTDQQNNLLAALDSSLDLFRRHDSLVEPLQQLEALYESSGFIDQAYAAQNTPPVHTRTPSRDHFCQYLLSRQLEFICATEVDLLNHPEVFRHPRIKELYKSLTSLSVFERDVLTQMMPAPLLKATLKATPSVQNRKKEDYDEYKAKLDNINQQMKECASKLSPKAAPEIIKMHYDQYHELCRTRDVNAFIVAERRKELKLIDRAKESIKDYASANFRDKKLAAKEMGKIIATQAGKRLAIAIWREMKGDGSKNQWEEIGKELALDLAETVLVGAATYFLGPIGGKLGSSLMGMMRPQVDPYLSEFKKINEKLDENFKKINKKLDDLSKDIKDLSTKFDAIEGQFKSWGDYINERQALLNQIETLRQHILNTRNNVMTITTYHHMAMVDNTLPIAEIKALDGKIIDGLQACVRAFYDAEYLMLLGNNPLPSPQHSKPNLPQPLAVKIIQLYSNPQSKLFRPFDVTMDEISDIADLLHAVSSLYLQLRDQHIQTLSIAMQFFQPDSDQAKRELFWYVHDKIRHTSELKGELFSSIYQAKYDLLGHQNLALYYNFISYKKHPQNMNFFNGFGMKLLTAADAAPKQLRYDFARVTLNSDKQWVSSNAEDSRFVYSGQGSFFEQPLTEDADMYRYFIAPPHVDNPIAVDAEQTYALITFQANNFPIPIPVKIALNTQGSLTIYYGKSFDQKFDFCPVKPNDPLFKKSLEFFLLNENNTEIYNTSYLYENPRLEYFWSLPLSNYVLQLYVEPQKTDTSSKTNEYQNVRCEWHICHIKRHKGMLLQSIQLPKADRRDPNTRIKLQSKMSDNNATMQCQDSKWSADQKNTTRLIFSPDPDSQITPYGAATLLWHADPCKPQRLNSLTLLPFQQHWHAGHRVSHHEWKKQPILLASMDGRYQLRMDIQYGFDAVLNLYVDDKRLGSVFKEYHYQDKLEYSVVLQANDGHLVMYDQTGHAVAGSGFFDADKYKKASIILTDQGQLHLVTASGEYVDEIKPTPNPTMHRLKDGHRHLSNRLMPNQRLERHEYLTSSNQEYALKLVVESGKDPQLAVYRQPNGALQKILYSKDIPSAIAGFDVPFFVDMQSDGNLVLYSKILGQVNAQDASNTERHAGAFLLLTDDGKVQIWNDRHTTMIRQLN